MPFLTDQWYNPSSGYRAAKGVRKALEVAHEQVAELIHAKPTEIVFTEQNRSKFCDLSVGPHHASCTLD